MTPSWNLDEVSAAFAAAAVDPSRWNEAMEIAASTTGGFGAAMFPLRGRLPNVPLTKSMAQAMDTYIRDGWINRDERYQSVDVMLQRGVATDLDFTTPQKMSSNAYYEDFLARFNLYWYAGVAVASAEDQWGLALQRSKAQGPFSPKEVRQLATLSQSLGGAAALARAFGFARADAAMQAFELSASAIVLLNRLAEVIQVNTAAEKLLRHNPRIERRRLVCRDREATANLDRSLHSLIWTRSSAALLTPVRLPREGQRPILAYPVRLPAMSADVLSACQGLLILVDPALQMGPPEEALRSGFNLSAAEARLAMRLATGQSLEAASEIIGISKETSRVQLKSIFQKLDVHRQPELVAILARLLTAPF